MYIYIHTIYTYKASFRTKGGENGRIWVLGGEGRDVKDVTIIWGGREGGKPPPH